MFWRIKALNIPGWRINQAEATMSELNNMLNAAISHHEVIGRYLSIENIGILFGPELKNDFLRLPDSFSQNNLVYVK